MTELLKLPQIHVRGTPAELGRSQGEQLRPLIGAFVEQRLRAAKVYLYERGIRDEQTFRELGRRCLEVLKSWDNDGWVEHMALAEAAGIDAVDLYTTGNMTDIRDILALPQGTSVVTADAEGCTTALVPASHSVDGAVIASQTWDLNPSDLDYVVSIHRQPTDSVETWSITCAGCPSLVGMNALGVAVGTTNIKTRGSRVGIPYLSLLHKAIRCADRASALKTIIEAPRAAAHTYWAADAGGVDDIECTAISHSKRRGDRPLTRTNHCQDPSNARIEGEAATSSSKARLARVTAWLAEGKQSVERLKMMYADRSDGVDSVNRFPEDNQGTSTNACVIAIPARRELHACRGSSDRGEWVRLAFG